MDVGWHLKEIAWNRRVTLELGGNAAVVVEPDAGDLAAVARKIAGAAYGYAGQSCISVQRVLAHENIYVALRRELVEATAAIRHGDPADAGTHLRPPHRQGQRRPRRRVDRQRQRSGRPDPRRRRS